MKYLMVYLTSTSFLDVLRFQTVRHNSRVFKLSVTAVRLRNHFRYHKTLKLAHVGVRNLCADYVNNEDL